MVLGTCYRLGVKSDVQQPPDIRPSVPDRLYPQVVGAAWATLAPAVQRVHTDPGVTRAEGTARVSRAPGRLLGMVLDAARVPRSSSASPVQLAIWHCGAAEQWHRNFDGRPLVTHQSVAPGGLLAERIGVLEFRFRLLAQDGALVFRQESLALRVGMLRCPIPARSALVIAAREAAIPGADDAELRTCVDVRMTLPTGALLFAYRGTVRWQASRSPNPSPVCARGEQLSRTTGRGLP